MDIRLGTEHIQMYLRTFCGKYEHIQESDITAPDYMPDIGSIIDVSRRAYVLHKEAAAGSVTVTGDVIYHILYRSIQGGTESIAFSDGFSHTFEAAGAAEGAFVTASADAVHCQWRQISPRRLNVSSVIEISACVYSETSTPVTTSVEGAQDIETLSGTADLFVCTDITEKSFQAADEIEIPSAKAPVGDLLRYDADVAVSEVRTVNGKVVIKGAVRLTALYAAEEGGGFESVTGELPFAQIIDLPRALDESVTDVDAQLTSLSVSTLADEDGQMRRLRVTADVLVTAAACEQLHRELLYDAYGLETKLDMEKKDVPLSSLVVSADRSVTLRGAMAPAPGMPEISRVVAVTARPVGTVTAITDGRVQVKSGVEAVGLYQSDGDDNIYQMTTTLPLEWSQEAPQGEGLSAEGRVTVSAVSFNINMSSEVEIRVVCEVYIKILRDSTASQIISIKTRDEPACAERHSLVLYYPQKGDTLWETAKRYAVRLGELMELNGITEGEDISRRGMIRIERRP